MRAEAAEMGVRGDAEARSKTMGRAAALKRLAVSGFASKAQRRIRPGGHEPRALDAAAYNLR
jgi:hypothetical protein